MAGKKKIGRPTVDPKDTRVTVRFNEQQSEILTNYCKEKNITLSQGVREAVYLLKNKKD